MAELVCTVDKRLVIPPKMRGIFPNEDELVIEFTAGEPKEVPKYVADYFTKNYPHVYQDTGKPEPKKSVLEPEPKEEVPKEEFDPIEWLEINYTNIKEGLGDLTWQQIQKVASTMKLKTFGKNKERVIEMIAHDIKVKERQNEELGKHKDAY